MIENKPLEDIFGYWGEHPDYPSADWKYEVSNGDTRLGYWDWVEVKISQNGEK